MYENICHLAEEVSRLEKIEPHWQSESFANLDLNLKIKVITSQY